MIDNRCDVDGAERGFCLEGFRRGKADDGVQVSCSGLGCTREFLLFLIANRTINVYAGRDDDDGEG